MAIAYHTHTFEIPTATNAETQAGVITDKVVIPAGLAAALASYVTSTALTTTLADYALSASLGTAAVQDVGYFATAAQGALADTAVQPADIGSTVQAYSTNLDEYAAVNPTAAGLALLDDADAAAQRTTLAAAGTGVANTFSAKQTFSGSSPFEATYSEDGAGAGPTLDLTRVSTTPATDDFLATLRFMGRDSGGNATAYVQFRGRINDPTDASEDGAFEIVPVVAGAQVVAFGVANGIRVGAPTGLYQGTGTVNATGYYLNGVALPTKAANTFTAAQAVTFVTLTDGATITPDFTLSNTFNLTLGGNRTLANPSSKTVGQEILIVIRQNGTGGNTLAFGTQYLFPGGVDPTLSTAANAIDVIAGVVVSSTEILCNISKGFA